MQTQDIFHKLVKHTITQDDPVKAISDMRLAIKNTNVVLNLAISPGLILIPSNMIILKEEVAGYNNTQTLATKEMKSGVNEEVNKVALTLGVRFTPPPKRWGSWMKIQRAVIHGPLERVTKRYPYNQRKGSPFWTSLQ